MLASWLLLGGSGSSAFAPVATLGAAATAPTARTPQPIAFPEYRARPRSGRFDAPSWKQRDWKRTAGESDATADVDESLVRDLLLARDAAREVRDYARADRLLDQLWDLNVSVDDARRQRKWWFGRRARADGGERNERGAAAGKGRRKWFNEPPSR
jgi:hypothetical protein|eukprot:2554757-Prymnesium_polylepis.1